MSLDLLLYLLEDSLDRLGVLERRGLLDDFAAFPVTPYHRVLTIVDLFLELVATVLMNVMLFSDVYLRRDDGDRGTPAHLCCVEGLEPILNS